METDIFRNITIEKMEREQDIFCISVLIFGVLILFLGELGVLI